MAKVGQNWWPNSGNVIYRVPRRCLARARVVDTRRLESLHPSQGNADVARLQAYADVVERGPDQAAILKHEGSNAMEVSARVMTGQSVVRRLTTQLGRLGMAGDDYRSIRT